MLNNQDYQDKTDEELVILALENQGNFLYLIKRYENKLMRYIIRISSFDEEKTRDVLQDIFIKVYQNLNNFDLDLKFSSWIYRIAHNQVISEYRKDLARPEYTPGEENEEMLLNIKSNLDIENDIDLDILRKNIFQVLSKLDLKYREVLILKFLEEKDYKEISDILKKPMGTVGTLINRAKIQFKKIYEEK